jgi:archaellum component FlaD/FlaE
MESSDRTTRQVRRAQHELERDADQMGERADRLGHEIERTREQFRARRNDENVPGLPPEPEVEEDLEERRTAPDLGTSPTGDEERAEQERAEQER